MAYENLLKSVEESAGEKERELRQNAQKKAEEIRARAREQAGEIRARTVMESENAAGIERNKQLYLAKGKIKEQALIERENIFEAAFGEANRRLSSVRKEAKYPEIFRRLLIETIGAMGDHPFVIHTDARDLDLCRNMVKDLNISSEIRADIECLGGITATSSDGHISISNTIESRLERVKEHNRREIHAELSR